MSIMIQCARVHEGDPCSNVCSLGSERGLPRGRGHVLD